MLKFNDFLFNSYIVSIIKRINNSKYDLNYTQEHIISATKRIELLLKEMFYPLEFIEYVKITVLFQYLGYSIDDKDFVYSSYLITKKYLENTDIDEYCKEEILDAIKNQNSVKDMSSIKAAMILADKLDIDKNRLVDKHYFNKKYVNVQYIERIETKILSNILYVNFIFNKIYKDNIEVFLKEYNKELLEIKEAAKFFDLDCKFYLNGTMYNN